MSPADDEPNTRYNSFHDDGRGGLEIKAANTASSQHGTRWETTYDREVWIKSSQALMRYPEITLDITIDNNLSDIVAGGFDAGIRLGYALQRDMIAVPLGPMQRLTVVGSPRYFHRGGIPKTPPELLEHDCIRHRLTRARFFEWEFRIGGKDVTVDVHGRLVLDEMRAVLDAACQGNGLGLVFRQFATAEIASGAVVPIFDQFLPPDQRFHLYYANRAHTPSKLRAFIDFMQTVNRKVPK